MVQFRDNLFIGNYNDAFNPLRLLQAGITAVLNTAYELDPNPYNPIEIRYVKVAMRDDDSNPEYIKRLAIDTLKQMMATESKVMVNCAAGLSRSVYTALMAISELEGKDVHDLYEELRAVHPMANFGPLFKNTYVPIGAEEEE